MILFSARGLFCENRVKVSNAALKYLSKLPKLEEIFLANLVDVDFKHKFFSNFAKLKKLTCIKCFIYPESFFGRLDFCDLVMECERLEEITLFWGLSRAERMTNLFQKIVEALKSRSTNVVLTICWLDMEMGMKISSVRSEDDLQVKFSFEIGTICYSTGSIIPFYSSCDEESFKYEINTRAQDFYRKFGDNDDESRDNAIHEYIADRDWSDEDKLFKPSSSLLSMNQE